MSAGQKREYELIQHSTLHHMDVFLVQLVSRSPHGHSDLELGVLLEGSVTLYLEGSRIQLQRGDIYVVNRYQTHSFQAETSSALILAVQVSTKLYRHVDERLARMQFENHIPADDPQHRTLSRLLLGCAQAYHEEEAPLLCASMILECLHYLTRREQTHTISEKTYAQTRSNAIRMNRITDYLSEHYNDSISLKELAEHEGISPYYLSHMMKDMLGIGFQELLSRLRFEHALRLLEQTDLCLLDICAESGFSSSRYLNQAVQRQFGMSAIAYRRQHKPEGPTAAQTSGGNVETRFSFEDAAKKLAAITL